MNTNWITEFNSRSGNSTLVGYNFESSLEKLVQEGVVDCYVAASETGFSPLGANIEYLSHVLSIDENEIINLANWNRYKNPSVTIIGLPNQGADKKLRGAILAAGESSVCYERFATPYYGGPYRDFYYNVTYECISYAARILGAKKIAISHLSGGNNYHTDIATCTAESLKHFCDTARTRYIESLLFVNCCVEKEQLSGIEFVLNDDTKHRPIKTVNYRKNGFDVLSLDWR